MPRTIRQQIKDIYCYLKKLAENGIPGPQGPEGPAGPQGLPGVGGGEDLQETTENGNVTTLSMQSPQINSDDQTQTNWFNLNKDYFSLGEFGDGAGDPYNGAWSKYISFFDPNADGHDMATIFGDFGANSFNFNLSPAFVRLDSITNTTQGRLQVNLGVLEIVQQELAAKSTLMLETPTVSHTYKVPARTDATTTSYLAIGATDGSSTVYSNSQGVLDLSTLSLGGGSSTGLEALDEGNGIGWRLIGRDPAQSGNIGLNAIDFSVYPVNQATHGSTGNYSFSAGYEIINSGNYATTMGRDLNSSGDYIFNSGWLNTVTGDGSIAFGVNHTVNGIRAAVLGGQFNRATIQYATILGGNDNEASGTYSVVSGISNFGRSMGEFSGGMFGTDYTATGDSSWSAFDRLFNIGNGAAINSKSDAFTILKNGNIGIGISNFEANTSNERLEVSGYTLATGYKIPGGTGDDVILGNGSTASLAGIGGSKTTTADTGLAVDVSNPLGNDCNMLSANTADNTDTIVPSGTGGWAKILVNSASEPNVGGSAVKEAGGEFQANENMYLNIYHDANGYKYFWTYVTSVPNLDADTFAGLAPDQLIRRDVADSKVSGDLTFSDNVALALGSGGDNRFYHDGTNQLRLDMIGNDFFVIRDNTTDRFTFSKTDGLFACENIQTDSYKSTGSIATNNRVIILGDYDNDYRFTKIIVDDAAKNIAIGDATTVDTGVRLVVNHGSGIVTLGDDSSVSNNTFIKVDDANEEVLINAANLSFTGIPTYADDAAAGVGGLPAGYAYKTATGELRIKI